ncbi:unnamed protein product [Soboliphyme baturini]|uniref:Regulator of microtubule dynamics protein 1 n=1 Tax=Soboliphyme baturini TaxID=241478 RepID=A0A183J5L2_9BILA|nr:unnamed protein product [Soboliphyme baturini]
MSLPLFSRRELVAVKEELVQLKQTVATLRNEVIADYTAEAKSVESVNNLPDLDDINQHNKHLTYEYIDFLLASERPETRERMYLLLNQHADFHKDDFEFLWRFARCTFLYSQNFNDVDEEKKRKLCFEAKKYAYKALELKEDDANVQKWCAVTVGALSDFLGFKYKLQNGFTCREHILKSLKLNPDDWFSHYIYGRWCFTVAALSWVERKVASTLFEEPPIATYEEALTEFLEAERLQPIAWKENMLYIAKCHLQMGNNEMAHEYLNAADAIPVTSAEV